MVDRNPSGIEALVSLLESYDVGAGSAGLSGVEEKPDLAVSAMLLTELGAGYAKSEIDAGPDPADVGEIIAGGPHRRIQKAVLSADPDRGIAD